MRSLLLVVIVTKLCVLVIDLVNQCECIEVKILFTVLLKNAQKSEYCKDIIEKYFIKKFVMRRENERHFRKANKCHICNKLGFKQYSWVRDHCPITDEYRGSAYHSCNTNFQLAKKIPVIFHNLRGYDGHLIMQDISRLNQKINVIPNCLGKYLFGFHAGIKFSFY